MHDSIYCRLSGNAVSALIAGVALSLSAWGSTEQAKQAAIDKGLAYLAGTQATSASEGWWPYANDGTLAATASAALAFIEEGYLPGTDVVIDTGSGPVDYGDVVGLAVNYIFNRAAAVVPPGFGPEVDGYWRYAEDYNNNGVQGDDGGNDEAIFFNPGNPNRNVYTTGICVPVVFALGEALGKNTIVGVGSGAISGKTYAQALQDLMDWFAWGQVNPQWGVHRGGWRYDANYTTSDNSTAQWGALPILYADAWGLGVAKYVRNELTLWVNYIQNPSGGSGYDHPNNMVNVSKTGGLLLELAAIGAPVGDPRVVNALNYINANWMTVANATWDGNLGHPYGMWAVYKALQVYEFVQTYGPAYDERFLIGFGIPNAPGGFTIGQDWWAPPVTSLPGDWYAHYCELLVTTQNPNGSWTGYDYWTGALATGWYVNILNAAGVVNRPPIAVGKDIIVCADPGGCSASVAAGDVDNGSYDPDDDPITLELVPPGPYPLGANLVDLVVTDDKGESDTVQVVITVIDCEPPEAWCEAGTNPAGQPVPPQSPSPKAGQNPDGFYRLMATDLCSPVGQLAVYVADSGSGFVAGPFPVGQKVKITQAPGGKPGTKPMPGGIVHITLRGDAFVYATDAAGNTGASCSCLVPPPPK